MAPSLWPLYLLDTHRHMSIASLQPKRYTLCAKQVASHSPWSRLCEIPSPARSGYIAPWNQDGGNPRYSSFAGQFYLWRCRLWLTRALLPRLEK